MRGEPSSLERAVLVTAYWKNDDTREPIPTQQEPGPFYARTLGELMEAANTIYCAGYYISYYAEDGRRLEDRAAAEKYLTKSAF